MRAGASHGEIEMHICQDEIIAFTTFLSAIPGIGWLRAVWRRWRERLVARRALRP